MNEIRDQTEDEGRTIVFVSHKLASVEPVQHGRVKTLRDDMPRGGRRESRWDVQQPAIATAGLER